MPYVNIKITKEGNVTPEQKRQLIEGATKLLADVLHKNTKTLVVTIDEVDMDNWGIGGVPVTELRAKEEAKAKKKAEKEMAKAAKAEEKAKKEAEKAAAKAETKAKKAEAKASEAAAKEEVKAKKETAKTAKKEKKAKKK